MCLTQQIEDYVEVWYAYMIINKLKTNRDVFNLFMETLFNNSNDTNFISEGMYIKISNKIKQSYDEYVEEVCCFSDAGDHARFAGRASSESGTRARCASRCSTCRGAACASRNGNPCCGARSRCCAEIDGWLASWLHANAS